MWIHFSTPKETFLTHIIFTFLQLLLAASTPCFLCHTIAYLSFVLSPLIVRTVTYLRNCGARGKMWSICFRCLFHRALLIRQKERDLRTLPRCSLSCIDRLVTPAFLEGDGCFLFSFMLNSLLFKGSLRTGGLSLFT